MKRIIILFITAILLTGCNASYDINIKQDKIEDSIKIYTTNQTVQTATDKTIKEFTEKLGNWERGYDFYKRELYATDKITGYNYTYSFNYNEYDAMSQIRKCYKDFQFDYQKDTIIIKTSKEFLCQNYYQEVKSLQLNIQSEYKILNSNADTKTANIHTWNINKTNYKNKPIEITISKNKITTQENIKEKKLDIIKILIIIIFILLIIILIIRKKEQKQR